MTFPDSGLSMCLDDGAIAYSGDPWKKIGLGGNLMDLILENC